jgi:WD40 repeat protein
MAMSDRYDDADYYAVLQVPLHATEDDIRIAYRRLARMYHPDTNGGTANVEMMKLINAAYHVLSDTTRRREYDGRHGYYRARSVPQGEPIRTTRPNPTPPPPPRRPPATTHPTRSRYAPSSPGIPMESSSGGPYHLFRQIHGYDVVVSSLYFARDDSMLGVGYRDGHVELWDVMTRVRYAAFNLRVARSEFEPAGVLQEIRLSPNGSLAMAWGFGIGTCVWNTLSNQLLWSSTINGPRGAMDGILADTPALFRLAIPSAPLALAEQDPIAWSHHGNSGTDIVTHPFDSKMSAMQATPIMHCEEPSVPRLTPTPMPNSRILLRKLSADGEALLTFSNGPASPTVSNASILHWWNLRQHGRLGAPGPQRQGSINLPGRVLTFPIAVSANAALVATQFDLRTMRIYNVHSGQHTEVPTGPIPEQSSVALSGDGSLLALMHPETRRAELWDVQHGERLQTWSTSVAVSTISFAGSPRYPALAFGREDGMCEIWAS